MNMKQLFTSATIKLTAWYLAILLSISILFSIVLYQVSISELSSRLGIFETRLENPDFYVDKMPDFTQIKQRQLNESRVTLFAALFYLNAVIFVVGGFGSYALARRSLKPIEESHEAQARFASDASHELRTPLAVMRSELEVALRDQLLSKSDMKELLESNLEEVKRLSALSQTLLQLSRHDYSNLEMKRVELGEMIEATINLPSIATARVDYTPSKQKHYVYAHSDSIKELFMVLTDNALRYSPADESIHINLKTHNNTISVRIKNGGKGIAEKDLPHIFERFYRGDKSRTSGSKSGYGLGLALAKTIADIHRAVIDISSKPDDYTLVSVSFTKYKKIS